MTARTRWIGLVVGLLVGNALAVATLIGAAGGDTRRRVLPDAYARAAAWDGAMAEAATSAHLGWTAALAARGRDLALTVRDRAGALVAGAAVVVHGRPRGRADEPITATLVPTTPGVYRAALPGTRAGLHDLVVVVERGADRWVTERIVDLGAAGQPAARAPAASAPP